MSLRFVVVHKKNVDVRLWVDYRRLNLQTIKVAYTLLPNLEESFSGLSGFRWFSEMDLKTEFYQIEMEEGDKQKQLLFVLPFWEWNPMLQGITNAPNIFQRLMEKCMRDLNLCKVLVFLMIWLSSPKHWKSMNYGWQMFWIVWGNKAISYCLISASFSRLR